MFKVGEYIIYKRDLCKVKGIEQSPITGEDYYSLLPVQDESLSIKVPTNNKLGNLRYPITKKEAEELIKKIPNIEPIKVNDKSQDNAYKELMKTNNHEDLIKIIKTTYLRNELRLNQGKKITNQNQLYFEQAEKYLYNELGYALEKDYEECKKYIIEKLTEISRENKDAN